MSILLLVAWVWELIIIHEISVIVSLLFHIFREIRCRTEGVKMKKTNLMAKSKTWDTACDKSCFFRYAEMTCFRIANKQHNVFIWKERTINKFVSQALPHSWATQSTNKFPLTPLWFSDFLYIHSPAYLSVAINRDLLVEGVFTFVREESLSQSLAIAWTTGASSWLASKYFHG